MQITKIFYAPNRKGWRQWLQQNHKKKKDIWLQFYNKGAEKPNVAYNEAVQEAICFGWIDSAVKKINAESRVQRFTPRNPKSNWSELNKERARKMIREKKMTTAGRAVLCDLSEDFVIPSDILKELKKDKQTWANFKKLPESYQRIRIGFIDGSRNRKEFFKERLAYFLKMTKENRIFGISI